MWNLLISPFRTLTEPAEKQLSSQWTPLFFLFSPFRTTCQDDCRFRCAGFSKQWNKQPILICCQHLVCASLSAGRSVLITILWTPAGREGLSKCLQLCWSASHSTRDWVICPRYSTDLPTSRLQGPKCPEDNGMTETGDGLGALMQNAERKSPGSCFDVPVLSGVYGSSTTA